MDTLKALFQQAEKLGQSKIDITPAKEINREFRFFTGYNVKRGKKYTMAFTNKGNNIIESLGRLKLIGDSLYKMKYSTVENDYVVSSECIYTNVTFE